MRASDQYHAGIVVDDFDAALADFSALFGYEFASPLELSTPVRFPEGGADDLSGPSTCGSRTR